MIFLLIGLRISWSGGLSGLITGGYTSSSSEELTSQSNASSAVSS